MNLTLNLKRKRLCGIILLLVASICIGHGEAAPKKEEKKPLSVFMRKKLAAS